MINHNSFIILLATMLVTACGGGGGGGSSAPTYSGLTTPAAITVTNAEALSEKSLEGVDEAVAQNAANEANPFGISISQTSSNTNQLIINTARQAASTSQSLGSLPAGITVTAAQLGYPFCGGSVSVPDNWQYSTYLNGTMILNNLCINDPYFGIVTMNGSVIFTENATQFTLQYVNLTINDGSTTETINMTVSCTSSDCSISTDYVGSDGSTYRIANLDITGSGSGPYTFSATFYHPDYGSVTVTGSGIYLNCPDGSISAGTLNLSGASGSSASVLFTGCNTYSGTWNDGTTSGSF